MIRGMLRATIAAAATLLLSVSAWAAPKVTIADIAPPQTMFVFSIDDMTATKNTWTKSSFGELLKHDQINALIQAINAEAKKVGVHSEMTPEKWLKEAGIKTEELPTPTGAVGVAIIAHVDAKTGKPGFRWVVLGQFADETSKVVEAIDKALDKLEKEKHITVKEEDAAGVKVRKITMSDGEDKPKRRTPARGMEDDEDEGVRAPGKAPFNEAYFANTGESFLLGSDLETVERALDVLAGKAKGESLATTPALAQCRKHHVPGTLGFMAFFVEPLREVVEKTRGKLPPEDFRTEPSVLETWCRGLHDAQSDGMLKFIGVKGTTAVTASFAVDSETAALEADIVMLTPNKAQGLLGLLQPNNAPFNPPAFVSPETHSVAQINVRLDKVMGMVRDYMKTFDADRREQAEAMFDQAETMVGPIFAQLGPEVYIMQTIEQPFSAESGNYLFAIKCGDTMPLSNLLTSQGAMAGLKPRDFEGSQIFEADGGFVEIAVGLGAGHVFIAKNAKHIENALRAATQAAGPRLATEARFKATQQIIPANSVVMGYQDTAQTLRYVYWMLKNFDRIQEEEERKLRERWGIKEEDMPAKKKTDEKANAWVDKLPDVDLVLKHLGDSATDAGWIDDGFRFRIRYLRGAGK